MGRLVNHKLVNEFGFDHRSRELRPGLDEHVARMRATRDRLHRALDEALEGLPKLNGHPTRRLPHTANISFPYVEGDRVISRDEEGDPVFEDVGHTPRFLGLVRKHMERLSGQDG